MNDEPLRQLFKPAILNASAYHVPESGGLIKLDAMENPYTWSDEFKQQWLAYLQQADLNRYPDAGTRDMRASLRKLFEVPEAADMMFGNGSDELIQILLMALKPSANVVMAPEPTFVMYRYLSDMLGLDFVGVPLKKDFSLDVTAMLAVIEHKQPAIIFLAWPNNPTGNAFARKDLEVIIEASNGLVIIDEAYHVFAGRTMLPYVEEYANVLVMRTLSKLGLAGLRLGTLIGPQALIHELEKIRLPYNIGTLNQLSVNFVCQHMDVLYQQAAQIRQDRLKLYQDMANMPQLEVWPTEANFILFRVKGMPGNDVHAGLMEQKILIKNLAAAHQLLIDCLRVTVGTRDENEAFLQALRDILDTA